MQKTASSDDVFDRTLHSGFFHGAFMDAPRVKPDKQHLALHQGSVAIIGIPFDSTCISRPGASGGPKAIRDASEQFMFYNASLGINLQDYFSFIDCGDVPVIPGSAEKTFSQFEETLGYFYDANIMPVVLGGDHAISIPCFRAFAKKYQKPALVMIDSHYDCSVALGGESLNHTCPVVRAVEAGFPPEKIIIIGVNGWLNPSDEERYAKEKGITVIHLHELLEAGLWACVQRCGDILGNDHDIYLSVDIDAVDASCAPGTGVPAMGGLSSREAIKLVRQLGQLCSGVRAFDIVEVAPAYDHNGITGRLAACLIVETLAAVARGRINGHTGSARE